MLPVNENQAQPQNIVMLFWLSWWNLVLCLRPAFSRYRAFLWFAVVLAAFCARGDLWGRHKLLRALGLRQQFYDRRVEFFHSPPVRYAQAHVSLDGPCYPGPQAPPPHGQGVSSRCGTPGQAAAEGGDRQHQRGQALAAGGKGKVFWPDCGQPILLPDVIQEGRVIRQRAPVSFDSSWPRRSRV
jgi:hypothetical protein